MSSKPRRKRNQRAASGDSEAPIGIIVRRGALRRFDQLTQKTAELPVSLIWDRRVSRASASGDDTDERRATPPFTWELADFVVVPASKPQARKPSKPRRRAS